MLLKWQELKWFARVKLRYSHVTRNDTALHLHHEIHKSFRLISSLCHVQRRLSYEKIEAATAVINILSNINFQCVISLSRTGGILMVKHRQTWLHDQHSTNTTTKQREETTLQDFPVILKRTLQNYRKILKECFFGTDSDVFSSFKSSIT